MSTKDLEAYVTEYGEKGALSDESYAALESRGFGRDIVDGYVDGQVARAVNRNAKIHAAAGGERGFNDLSTWAAANLSAEEIGKVNTMLNSGDLDSAALVVQGLRARMGAPAGRTELGGNVSTVPAGPRPFRDTAAMVEMQRDPRYATSSDFREEFMGRLRASQASGAGRS